MLTPKRWSTKGGVFITLSDCGVAADRTPIPCLLALSAVHQHLVVVRKRLSTALVVESGEPREVMHFALLISYGTNTINPYMTLAAVQSRWTPGRCG